MPSAQAIPSRARSVRAGAAPTAAPTPPPGAAPPAEVLARLLDVQGALERGALFERLFAEGDPDALLRALKAESERLWYVDPGLSLRAAEVLIQGAALAGRPDHGALGLMARADAMRLLGQYPQSLPVFEAAAQAFIALDDEVGWARTRIGWLHAMHMLGRADEALPQAEQARNALVRHGEWLRAGALDVNTAVVCQQLGRMQRAVSLYDRALGVYAGLGQAAELPSARTRANKGFLLTLLGDFRAALELFDSTREVWLRNGQDAAVLRQDLMVATGYLGQGRYTRALQLLAEIRAAREHAGHAVDAAWATLYMVEGYLGLNRNGEAAATAEDAISGFERCGTPTEAAKARLYASLALARLGETERAMRRLDEAGATFERAGLAGQLALVTLQRARLNLTGGDVAAAREAAGRARDLFATQGLAVRRAEAETVGARAALEAGDADTADQLARAALVTTEERGAPWLAHEAHLVLARLARGAGHLEEALRGCELAVASIEQVQSRLAPELRSHFLDDKVQVFREAIDTSLSAARPAEALAYLERAKSRALVDYVATNAEVRLRSRRPANGTLLRELGRLRDEHNWLYNRLNGYGLSHAGDQALTPVQAAAMQEAVREREGRIAQLLERLVLQDAGSVEGLVGAPGAAPGVPVPEQGSVLLEYFLHEDGGVVFAVTRDGVAAVPLPAGAPEVQRHLFRWQLSLDACANALTQGRPVAAVARNAAGVLRGLHKILLAPVEHLVQAHERVVIVPFGAGHAVPWQALHDGSGSLLERVEVCLCPSSSMLNHLASRRRHDRGPSVVFANSRGGLLRHVVQEAEGVAAALGAEVFSEARATRAALREAVPGCKVLHLAAHGEARLDDPTFAHLQLADGQLAAADVFNLSLDGALVTLSACETGRAVVTGGDELIGLSRGFLFAGASTLVQSLWRVEDESTAHLMAHFYRELAAGQTATRALRQAQLALLDERDGLPYFWAPFQVVGDGDWRLGPV
ncbi:MAG TPA: CHAT domain-containing protein [Chloroflexota bacterium]|nr:CHAT domain-containing protein [Chloroflexota bacterium]